MRWKSSIFKIKKGKSLRGAREETREKSKEQSTNQSNYKTVHFTHIKPTGLNWTVNTLNSLNYSVWFGFWIRQQQIERKKWNFSSQFQKFLFLSRRKYCGVQCESKRMIFSWSKCKILSLTNISTNDFETEKLKKENMLHDTCKTKEKIGWSAFRSKYFWKSLFFVVEFYVMCICEGARLFFGLYFIFLLVVVCSLSLCYRIHALLCFFMLFFSFAMFFANKLAIESLLCVWYLLNLPHTKKKKKKKRCSNKKEL